MAAGEFALELLDEVRDNLCSDSSPILKSTSS